MPEMRRRTWSFFGYVPPTPLSVSQIRQLVAGRVRDFYLTRIPDPKNPKVWINVVVCGSASTFLEALVPAWTKAAFTWPSGGRPN